MCVSAGFQMKGMLGQQLSPAVSLMCHIQSTRSRAGLLEKSSQSTRGGLIVCDKNGYGKVKEIRKWGFPLHYSQLAVLGKESEGSNFTFTLV